MLVMFTICSLAFSAFAIPISNAGGLNEDCLADRASIVLTLMLTTV